MTDASDRPPLPRFTLAGLLELIAGIGLFFALVTQLELFGLCMALAGFLVIAAVHRLAFAHERPEAMNNVWGCLIVILALLLIVALLLPTVSNPRETSRRTQCSNNLRQLALALHNYHDVHGHFPSPHLPDANGKPMHSWRVLILPYMDMDLDDLYREYHFDEPWNGPNNSKLTARIPSVFRCPSDKKLPPGMTSYFAITGSGRTKDGKAALQQADITDFISNTIALVESSTVRVNWLEPRDLTVEDILSGKNTAEAPCPCSYHGRKDRGMWRSAGNMYHLARFDASVGRLPTNLDAATLKALLTIDGGESQGFGTIMWSPDDEEYLWPGFWVLLAAEVAFVSFAILRRLRLARRMHREAPHR